MISLKKFSYLQPWELSDLKRYGTEGDGGYVIPESICRNISTIISMGVSNDWSFEEAIKLQHPNINIFCYDHTVSATNFRISKYIELIKILIGMGTLKEFRRRSNILKSYNYFFSKIAKHNKNRVFNKNDTNFDITLNQIIQKEKLEKILLKVDIEGGEYRIIDEIIINSHLIEGIAIEFHDTQPFRPVFENSIKKLLDHFFVAHIHANNCISPAEDGLPEVLEITLIHKRYFNSEVKCLNNFPVKGLDFKSVDDRADISFNFS